MYHYAYDGVMSLGASFSENKNLGKSLKNKGKAQSKDKLSYIYYNAYAGKSKAKKAKKMKT